MFVNLQNKNVANIFFATKKLQTFCAKKMLVNFDTKMLQTSFATCTTTFLLRILM